MKYLFSLIIGLGFLVQASQAQVSFLKKGSPCVGTPITFYNNSTIPPDSVNWSFGNDDIASDPDSVEYTYYLVGEYVVTLTVVSGGSSYSYFETLIIHDNPECDFYVDSVPFSSYTRIFTDQSVSDTSFMSFKWDFGNGQIVTNDSLSTEYRFSEAGSYDVRLWSTDNYGCTDSAMQSVVVSNLYRVPNVFTPNADGVNDQFIVTVNGEELFSIEIYSRWGNLVFKRENVNNLVWDGYMPDGSKVKPGTYFYVIAAHDTQNVYDPESGYITVFYGKDE